RVSRLWWPHEPAAEEVHFCLRNRDALLKHAIRDRDPLELWQRLLCLDAADALKTNRAFDDSYDAGPPVGHLYVNGAVQGESCPLIVLDAETAAGHRRTSQYEPHEG